VSYNMSHTGSTVATADDGGSDDDITAGNNLIDMTGGGLKRVDKRFSTPRPRLADITTVDWIKGGTLDRITIVHRLPNRHYKCIVRVLSMDDQQFQCDGCERRHSVINVACSRNQNQTSWARRLGAIYDFKTRKLIATRPVKVDESWGPYNVGLETWYL